MGNLLPSQPGELKPCFGIGALAILVSLFFRCSESSAWCPPPKESQRLFSESFAAFCTAFHEFPRGGWAALRVDSGVGLTRSDGQLRAVPSSPTLRKHEAHHPSPLPLGGGEGVSAAARRGQRILVTLEREFALRSTDVGAVGRWKTPHFAGNKVTSFKSFRFQKDELETPHVVSYFLRERPEFHARFRSSTSSLAGFFHPAEHRQFVVRQRP